MQRLLLYLIDEAVTHACAKTIHFLCVYPAVRYAPKIKAELSNGVCD